MPSPRTDTTIRPSTPGDPPRRPSLSALQVAGSALAAVSSAVVASFFGVAGTLVGAALASVIATVGTALYTESLRKTNERLRHLVGGRPARPSAAAGTRPLPASLDPRRAPAKRSGPRWSRVAVYAVSVFAVAMGIVTGIELVGRQPVSALVGHASTSGTTTLGELTDASSHSALAPSAPAAPTSSTPAPTAGETGQPTPSPTTESTTASSSAARSTAAPTGGTASSSAPVESVAPPP